MLLAANVLGLAAQRYPCSGLLLRVNPRRSEVEISMQEIPGFMDAMVMTLPVNHSINLQDLRPGDMVDFTLVVTGKSSYGENFRIRRFESLENDPQGALRLAQVEKALNPSSESVLCEGQHVPDFSLIDQTGRSVTLSQFSGKIVAMTFVYTRCPLPNFCFRLSNNFGQLQKRFARQMGRDLILLTITLDPANDQPETLAKYGSIWKANSAYWHLLTGPASAIEKATTMFGVVFSPDEGMVIHSLHTVIIGRRGELVANLEGNEFTSKQLGDFVESILNPNSRPTL